MTVSNRAWEDTFVYVLHKLCIQLNFLYSHSHAVARKLHVSLLKILIDTDCVIYPLLGLIRSRNIGKFWC